MPLPSFLIYNGMVIIITSELPHLDLHCCKFNIFIFHAFCVNPIALRMAKLYALISVVVDKP